MSARTLPSGGTGAVLFADISGFTRMTTTLLDELGSQRGAEQISYHLSEIFEALISQVHRYGGAVVYFSGDAITCWFEEDRGVTATSCAFAMQDVMTAFDDIRTTSTPISVGIKTVISSGPVSRFMIGDPDIMKIDVLAGRPLVDISLADHLARRGEVLVDEQTLRGIQDHISVQEWRRDSGGTKCFGVVGKLGMPPVAESWEMPTKLSEQVLRSWILPAVYRRTREGHGQYLAELRPVVALFMQFEGLSYHDAKESSEKLDQFICWVQQAAQRYDGSLLQVTVGDKGSTAYLAFGAPVAHHNDSERAILTALILQQASDTFSFINAVRMGISQGEMYTGAYGSSRRMAYSALGSDVNLAARLMSKAGPNETLVTARVVRHNLRHYDFDAPRGTQLKGFAIPVITYRLVGKKSTAPERLKDTPMAGRGAEKNMVQNLLRLLERRDHAQIRPLLLEGEAGIGKSRLITYLLELAAEKNLNFAVGSGNAIEKNAAYFVWIPIVERLLQGLTGASVLSPEAVTTFVQAQFPQWANWLPLLNPLLHFDFEPREEIERMDHEVQAANRHEMVRAFVDRWGTQAGLIIALEDAQWIDSASWRLLLHIARAAPPLLLVVSTRPLGQPHPKAYSYLCEQGEAHHFLLERLDDQAIVQIACQDLGVDSLPGPTQEFMLQKAQGNPLYSQELAFALRDTGLLAIENGMVTQSPTEAQLAKLNFPDTISSIILERIDRLDTAEQLTLKVASVLGSTFPLQGLSRVYPQQISHEQLAQALDHLAALGMTSMSPAGLGGNYVFKHVIIHDVSYNLLLFEQRRTLHRQVAQWYERTFPEDTTLWPVLAYHWELAEDKSKTLLYLEKAGQQALSRYANREAIEFLRKAIRLADGFVEPPRSESKAMWHRQIGQAYYHLGEMDKSRRYFRKALWLLNEREPQGQARLLMAIGNQVVRQLAHRYLGRWLHRGALADRRLVEIARTYDALSLTYIYNGAQHRSTYATYYALNVAEKAAAKGEEVAYQLSRGYANVGASLARTFDLASLSNTYFARARRIARDSDNLQAMGWVEQLDALALALRGHGDEAIRRNQLAMSIYEQLGDRRHWEECAHNLSQVLYRQGNYETCIGLCRDHFASAASRQDKQSMLLAAGMEAKAWIERGEPKQALDQMSDLDLQETNGDLGAELLFGQGCLALAHWWRGDLDNAARLTLDSHSLLQHNPMNLVSIYGFASLAETALSLLTSTYGTGQERTQLHAVARDAVAAMRRTARKMSPVSKPLASMYQGWLWDYEAMPGRALRQWRRGVKQACTYANPLLEGRLRFRLSRCEQVPAVVRQRHSRLARRIFERLDAAPYLRHRPQYGPGMLTPIRS